MDEKKKPKYHTWQNTVYMLKNAWHIQKSVLFLCIAVAVATAAATTTELLIAPVILRHVENRDPPGVLPGSVAVFALLLMALSALNAYLNENTIFGRISIRTDLVRQIAEKVAQRVNGVDTDRVWDCLDRSGLADKVRSLPHGIETHIGRQVYEDGVELSDGTGTILYGKDENPHRPEKDPVLTASGVLAVLSMFFVHPDAAYVSYIDYRVLTLLFSLK